MNAYTRMSERGQVVVPKSLRDRKGWTSGTDLEVIDTGDGILLRPRRHRERTLTFEQAVARLREIYTHRGPTVPLEKLSWSPADGDED